MNGQVPVSTRSRFEFFLGGADLEMQTISELLREHAQVVHDLQLPWTRATTAQYAREIHDAAQRGNVPVLVELRDPDRLAPGSTIVIDHHGDAAGHDRPTSLEQIFSLLSLPIEHWSRRLALVAANDRGHVSAMLELRATPEELRRIRAADRAAQQITEADEAAAEVAVAARERPRERLALVRAPHARVAAVTDRMDARLGGPGYENLLVLSPGEANLFGEGALILRMAALGNGTEATFPGAWFGGDLPRHGFWGVLSPRGDVLRHVVAALDASTPHGVKHSA